VNDLSLSAGGAMYFTNHSGGSVFYRDAEGTVSEFTGFNVPNGIEWVEEISIVYVCLSDEQKVFVYDTGPDGSLTNGREFAFLNRPDGITLDKEGNVYVANIRDHEVVVFDSLGTRLGNILVDETRISNCAFGGPENKTLYMTGGSGVYKVKLEIAGRTFPAAAAVEFSGKGMRGFTGVAGIFTPVLLTIRGGGKQIVILRGSSEAGFEIFDLNGRRTVLLP